MAKGIKLRSWEIQDADYETEDQFRAAVELELARFEHIGERFGIALIAGPKKQKVGDDYVTVGWVFQTATIPAAREATPEPIPEEEIEAVEDAAEAVLQNGDITDDPYAEDS